MPEAQAARSFGEMTRDRSLLAALLACGSLRLIMYLQHGFVFDILPYQWQLIDLEALRLHPLESINALHAQPPLLNILLAIALMFPSPGMGEAFLHIIFLGATAAMIAVVFHFLRCFGYGSISSGIGAALFGVLPQVLVYEHWFFYPHLEAALLLGAMYYASRYVSARATSAFIGLAICLVSLGLLRALFHLGWIIVVLAIIWIAGGARHRSGRWRDGGIAIAAATLVLALYAKNYGQFGFFSPSSWPGIGMANIMLPLQPDDRIKNPEDFADFRARLARGKFSEAMRRLAENDLPWTGWARTAIDCDGSGDVPAALCAVHKQAGGHLNLNHASFVAYSKELGADALSGVSHYWRRYLRQVASNYLAFFGLPSWENTYAPKAISRAYLDTWSGMALYDRQSVGSSTVVGATGLDWLMRRIAAASIIHLILIPIAILIVLLLTARECRQLIRRQQVDIDWILPVLAVALFLTVPHWVNAGETHRMRYSIEPIIFLALAAGLRLVLPAVADSHGSRPDSPAG